MNQNESQAVIGYASTANNRERWVFTPGTLASLEGTSETETATAQGAPPELQNGAPGARKTISLGLRLITGDVAGRMARRLTIHAEKAARSDMRTWLAEGIYEHRQFIVEAFGPIVAVCREFGLDVPAAEQVADFLLARSSRIRGCDLWTKWKTSAIASSRFFPGRVRD